jgi:hypothetical protein
MKFLSSYSASRKNRKIFQLIYFFVLTFCVPNLSFAQGNFFDFYDDFITKYRPDSIEYKNHMKMIYRDYLFQAPRLYPHGDYSIAHAAIMDYVDQFNTGNPAFPTCPNPLGSNQWLEVRPKGEIPSLLVDFRGAGQVHRITFDPAYNGTTNQTVYASSSFGGLWRSENAGQNWSNVNTDLGLPFTYTADVAIDPENSSTLFLATGYADAGKIQTPITASNSLINPIFSFGVYRSLDYGQSWQEFNLGQMAPNLFISSMYGGMAIRRIRAARMPDINNPSQTVLKLYAATSRGLFVCNDALGAGIWFKQTFSSALNVVEDFRGIEFMPGNTQVVYLSGKDILKSVDGGSTWIGMTGPTTGLDWSLLASNNFKPVVINLAVTPADPNRVYAYVNGYKDFQDPLNPAQILSQPAAKVFVYKGTIWEEIFTDETFIDPTTGAISFTNYYSNFYLPISCNPIIADEIYIGNTQLKRISNFDNGSSTVYDFGYSNSSSHPDFHALVFEPTTTNPNLFIGNHGGVFTHLPYGSIVHKSEGLNLAAIWTGDVSQMNKNIFSVGLQDQGALVLDNSSGQMVGTQGGDGYATSLLENGDNQSIWHGDGMAPGRKKITHNPLLSGFIGSSNWYAPDEFRWNGTVNNSPGECKSFQAKQHPRTGKFWFGFRELQEYSGFDCNSTTGCWSQQSDLSITEHEDWAHQIADFQIAPSNPDVIYLVTQGVTPIPPASSWDVKSRILKSTNGGINGVFNPAQAKFQVISSSLPQCSYCTPNQIAIATGIAVSDVNENNVWVSFSGYDNFFKVYTSSDGGTNWTNADPQQTLKNLPVNDIIFQPGSNNRIIVATDAGVYFTENNETCWRKLGQNLPNCRVLELKINQCSNRLTAFTFGRGMWEVELPEFQLPANFIEITQNQIWTEGQTFEGNIKIKSGVEVTLLNAGLYMGTGTKIVVEPGAKLTVDGGIITNKCGKMWQGIELWGDGNQIQTANLQGVIYVLNGGTIENAHEAISVYNTSIYGQHGGMVFCDGANFINNRRSVSFLSYNKWNVSYFKNCKFEVNDEYIPGDPFFAHVTMWDVKGIEFWGCNFFNYSTQAVNGDNQLRGRGIVSYDANFTVDEYCELPPNQPGGNCINIYPSRFSGFYTCIDALKLIDTKNYFVDQTNFSNCVYGIHSAAFDEVTITRNNFEVGASFFDTNQENCAGIVVETGTGYKIEENSFVKLGGMLEQRTVGVGLINTIVNNESNIIYKNNFEDLYVGNLSNGVNQVISPSEQGVKYECNTNSNLEPLGSWDFDTEPDWNNQSGTPPPGTGIATKQGSSGMAAGNTFSHHPINGQTNYETDFKVYLPGISQTYEYYYWNILPETPLFISSNVLDITSPNIFQNTCDSRIRENNGEERNLGSLSEPERIENETSFLNAYQSKEQSELLLAQLTDGGNTPALKEEVETANSNQTWILRQELLGNAPHLSKAVLTEAAENTVALPEAVLVEILEANPDVLRDQEFLDFLAQKNQPLPSYIIDSLRARSTLITARTLLNESIQLDQQRMHKVANEMLIHYINDTLDTGAVKLLEWLANKNTLEADFAIAGLWFKQGRTQDAVNFLNSVTTNRNLNQATEALLNRTLNSFQIAQSYQNNHSLNGTEVDQLNNIAQGKGDYPATLAKNLLSLHQQQPYPTHLVLPQQQGNARKAKASKNNPISVLGSLQIQPNPADQWLAFTIGELKGLSDQSIIQVSSAQGQVITEIKLDKGKGQYLLDTRAMVNGIYFYKVLGSKESISGKFVVQHE